MKQKKKTQSDSQDSLPVRKPAPLKTKLSGITTNFPPLKTRFLKITFKNKNET